MKVIHKEKNYRIELDDEWSGDYYILDAQGEELDKVDTLKDAYEALEEIKKEKGQTYLSVEKD